MSVRPRDSTPLGTFDSVHGEVAATEAVSMAAMAAVLHKKRRGAPQICRGSNSNISRKQKRIGRTGSRSLRRAQTSETRVPGPSALVPSLDWQRFPPLAHKTCCVALMLYRRWVDAGAKRYQSCLFFVFRVSRRRARVPGASDNF